MEGLRKTASLPEPRNAVPGPRLHLATPARAGVPEATPDQGRKPRHPGSARVQLRLEKPVVDLSPVKRFADRNPYKPRRQRAGVSSRGSSATRVGRPPERSRRHPRGTARTGSESEKISLRYLLISSGPASSLPSMHSRIRDSSGCAMFAGSIVSTFMGWSARVKNRTIASQRPCGRMIEG